MTASRHDWATLSWTDFAARDLTRTVAVLPIAAIEQHGPHLPVGVDMMIAEGHLAAVKAALPAGLDVLFLPLQAIGKSNEHLAYPGTLTLSAETAIRAWTEIGESVARAGVRRLVLANAHGGNVPVMDIVARELRVRARMLAVTCSWSRLGRPEGLYSPREEAHGIHGGDYETSLMLAYRPETVKREAIADFAARAEAIAQRHARLRVTQPVGFGWMAQDNNPTGVVGEADRATAEKGHATSAHVAEAFIALLQDVASFDLAQLADGPLDR